MSNLEVAAQTIVKMNEEKTVMNEKTFVTKWLLTLRDFINGDDVSIGMWLQENDITTFSEVCIVDNKNEPLFNVPSILMRQEKLLPDTVSSGISDILYRAENMNNVIPGRGNQFINSEITQKIVSPNTTEEYQRRWDAIFVRYDLDPVFSAIVSDVITPTDDGDFDGYEEL